MALSLIVAVGGNRATGRRRGLHALGLVCTACVLDLGDHRGPPDHR